MDTDPNTKHSFDLRGLKIGDEFMGCRKCWWKSDGPVAMVHQCPKCGSGNVGIFRVNENDAEAIKRAPCQLGIAVGESQVVLPMSMSREDAEQLSQTVEKYGAVTWFVPLPDLTTP